ncbi:hypothetical protein NEPTK9_001391 [Candidatus Neptunochlamydia vexilliferae]|uniref:Uncharacterized protein n=1 Tax=Candidatus Neptunichlamydia vexilliferae TaxID=1651774 RepID=A0ABS0B1W4_9BACT|nr:hypothetical protein [Candidatus Neptunochlamydia vexilliferae]
MRKGEQGQTFHPKMIKEVEKFLEPGDQGYLLYRGKEQPYGENIKVMNFETYLS